MELVSNTFGSFATRTYGAYGHRAASIDGARTGFAGEVGEADLPWYLLGDRLYVPSLQRFISPDANSPFDAGGLNRYAYCGGDPINRIDPSGEAWWEWVIAGIGLVAAVAATVATAGALAAPIAAAAAGGLTAAVSTTTMVTLTAAVVIDVVAVVAEIGAIASLAAGDEKAAGIFGWVGLGTGIASGAVAGMAKAGLSATKSRALSFGSSHYVPTGFRVNLDYKRTTYTSLNGKHKIKLYEGAAAVEAKIPSRAIRDANGKIVDIAPRWTAFANPAGGVNYVTDSAIWSDEGLSNLSTIRTGSDSKPVSFLSGVHGSASGENWSRAGNRMHTDRSVYVDNINYRMTTLQSQAGRTHPLTVVDLGSMKGKDFDQLLDSPAHIVHHYCYSAADRRLIKRLGVGVIKLFKL